MTELENSSVKPFCGVFQGLQLSLGLRNLDVVVNYSLNTGSKIKKIPLEIMASRQGLQTIVLSGYIK
jgi:hypothetical protein